MRRSTTKGVSTLDLLICTASVENSIKHQRRNEKLRALVRGTGAHLKICKAVRAPSVREGGTKQSTEIALNRSTMRTLRNFIESGKEYGLICDNDFRFRKVSFIKTLSKLISDVGEFRTLHICPQRRTLRVKMGIKDHESGIKPITIEWAQNRAHVGAPIAFVIHRDYARAYLKLFSDDFQKSQGGW